MLPLRKGRAVVMGGDARRYQWGPQSVPGERCRFCLDIMGCMVDLKQEVLRVPSEEKKKMWKLLLD